MMWPFDWLLRGVRRETSDTFETRLEAFVESECRRPDGSAEKKERLSVRQKMLAARQAVDAVCEKFLQYVKRNIIRPHPKDFRVEQVDDRHTGRLETLFGETKTGNETRFLKVSFQNRLSLYLKVQAIILSQSLEVKVLFQDESSEKRSHRIDVPMDQYGSASEVGWNRLFENVFTEFLDWRARTLTPP